jgi:hypothetical protein
MTDDMIERVARAICYQNMIDDGYSEETSIRSADGEMSKNFRLQARAAIEAMREPTSEMCTAGHVAMENFTAQIEHRAITPIIWHSMIDAATQEK